MDAQGWFEFLLHKYFKWKYTAPNRYATTTMHLKRQDSTLGMLGLLAIRDRIFATRAGPVRDALLAASEIKGLGTAGASGPLAVLFPQLFGTVDQFAVKSLCKIRSLHQQSVIASMNPESLSINDAVLLVQIMRAKASNLNKVFGTDYWTPRRVDMVLWASER
ncbi:MAG: hypothetical protein HYX94_12500 [Chloroflexi bacterium]|nr:hypothetical protein [Chloroflexota bacterium]